MDIEANLVGWIILCLGIVANSELPDVPCDTNIYLEVGKPGIVHCNFQDFQFLAWINGDGSYGESIPFIYLDNAVKRGRGYESGDYDILPDGSLIINNVQLKHEFNFSVSYTPNVGLRMVYFVPVSVYVRPGPEYPVVNGLTNQQYIYQEVDFYSGSINCTMYGVRPRIELEWVYQSDVISMENEPSSTVSNTDGTYNTSLSSRYTIRDRSVWKITLQCKVAGEMADLFPTETTINLLNLKRVLQIPVIDGCYSQQEDCNLMMPRNGTLACSVLAVSLEYRMDISLDISADASGLSLTRIKNHHHPHTSGDMYDLTTSYQYTVDEGSTESVIKCSLSGMNSQPLDSMATARIIWQNTLYKQRTNTGSTSDGGDSNIGWMIASIILNVVFLIIIIIIIVKFKKKLVKNPEKGVPESDNDSAIGLESKARDDERTQESGSLLESDNDSVVGSESRTRYDEGIQESRTYKYNETDSGISLLPRRRWDERTQESVIWEESDNDSVVGSESRTRYDEGIRPFRTLLESNNDSVVGSESRARYDEGMQEFSTRKYDGTDSGISIPLRFV